MNARVKVGNYIERLVSSPAAYAALNKNLRASGRMGALEKGVPL